ncbi:hypothetical protein Xmau_03114 [Xenorhabdus mauleonii]|uniref:Uncharacterized protein n=1 Tax=Xenorhabdus mauleonii TaxID=351675 RepID=A0A1I3SJ73_9GAMM|nr:hypothetical protein [Xenorhabdus mauleonii]PHM39207.1 hypothetical protein Xmau_03114 [Xenorhabdus mauleonii]SFJ58798.1 hypothetical protein SAMN05421680_111135 [Xenorhabdus mauleonii]
MNRNIPTNNQIILWQNPQIPEILIPRIELCDMPLPGLSRYDYLDTYHEKFDSSKMKVIPRKTLKNYMELSQLTSYKTAIKLISAINQATSDAGVMSVLTDKQKDMTSPPYCSFPSANAAASLVSAIIAAITKSTGLMCEWIDKNGTEKTREICNEIAACAVGCTGFFLAVFTFVIIRYRRLRAHEITFLTNCLNYIEAKNGSPDQRNQNRTIAFYASLIDAEIADKAENECEDPLRVYVPKSEEYESRILKIYQN